MPSRRVTGADAIDVVIADMERMRPDLDLIGLPIVGRVLRLAQLFVARREERLEAFGLTPADFDVLASLRRRAGTGAVNVRELQRATMLSSGGMTKRLDRLEGAGLIERHPDPADRRGVLIKLSSAGLTLIDAAIPAVTTSENELVASVLPSAQLRRQVEGGLRRLLVDQEAV